MVSDALFVRCLNVVSDGSAEQLLSGGEDGVRWCQMLCLSDACSVVSDGIGWFS
jgi:hypothetical protein